MANTNEENKLKEKVEEEEEEENLDASSSSNGNKPFQLNPLAKPWYPKGASSSSSSTNVNQPFEQNPQIQVMTPEEDRSLFMTFSRGFPLTREQIITYFTRKYGDCLEEVFVHAPHGREAEFGKVVFKIPIIPTMILKDQEVVKVVFGGRSMWLKRYQRRQ